MQHIKGGFEKEVAKFRAGWGLPKRRQKMSSGHFFWRGSKNPPIPANKRMLLCSIFYVLGKIRLLINILIIIVGADASVRPHENEVFHILEQQRAPQVLRCSLFLSVISLLGSGQRPDWGHDMADHADELFWLNGDVRLESSNLYFVTGQFNLTYDFLRNRFGCIGNPALFDDV